MKITGVSGSPNPGGNNEKLIELALGIADEFTIQAIHSWMHIHGMLVVGDRAHFGGIAVKPADSDGVGIKTVKDTMDMVCETLSRLK